MKSMIQQLAVKLGGRAIAGAWRRLRGRPALRVTVGRLDAGTARDVMIEANPLRSGFEISVSRDDDRISVIVGPHDQSNITSMGRIELDEEDIGSAER